MFSPSRRTVSPLASDCQSEPVGLIVLINRTRRKLSMRQMRAIDEVQIFDDFEKVPPFLPFSPGSPLYKGQVAREGYPFTLPSPSLFCRFSLTLFNYEESVQSGVTASNSNTKSKGSVNESHSLAVSPVFKVVSSKKGSKGG